MMTLNFNYDSSRAYCQQIGLVWLGDSFLIAADADAKLLNMTQEQVDCAMRHHLWNVRYLFTPSNYSFIQRLKIAFYFLTGIGKK